MRFDQLKAFSRIVQVRNVSFEHRKMYSWLAVVPSVRLLLPQRSLGVCFDLRKAIGQGVLSTRRSLRPFVYSEMRVVGLQ